MKIPCPMSSKVAGSCTYIFSQEKVSEIVGRCEDFPNLKDKYERFLYAQ